MWEEEGRKPDAKMDYVEESDVKFTKTQSSSLSLPCRLRFHDSNQHHHLNLPTRTPHTPFSAPPRQPRKTNGLNALVKKGRRSLNFPTTLLHTGAHHTHIQCAAEATA